MFPNNNYRITLDSFFPPKLQEVGKAVLKSLLAFYFYL